MEAAGICDVLTRGEGRVGWPRALSAHLGHMCLTQGSLRTHSANPFHSSGLGEIFGGGRTNKDMLRPLVHLN